MTSAKVRRDHNWHTTPLHVEATRITKGGHTANRITITNKRDQVLIELTAEQAMRLADELVDTAETYST